MLFGITRQWKIRAVILFHQFDLNCVLLTPQTKITITCLHILHSNMYFSIMALFPIEWSLDVYINAVGLAGCMIANHSLPSKEIIKRSPREFNIIIL